MPNPSTIAERDQEEIEMHRLRVMGLRLKASELALLIDKACTGHLATKEQDLLRKKFDEFLSSLG
jgi:hypothetical protein